MHPLKRLHLRSKLPASSMLFLPARTPIVVGNSTGNACLSREAGARLGFAPRCLQELAFLLFPTLGGSDFNLSFNRARNAVGFDTCYSSLARTGPCLKYRLFQRQGRAQGSSLTCADVQARGGILNDTDETRRERERIIEVIFGRKFLSPGQGFSVLFGWG